MLTRLQRSVPERLLSRMGGHVLQPTTDATITHSNNSSTESGHTLREIGQLVATGQCEAGDIPRYKCRSKHQ